MTPPTPPALECAALRSRRSPFGSDLSYLLPMALFLAFTQIGVAWPDSVPIVYVAKTLLVAMLLALCWPAYTKIRWDAWPLGILVGVLGIVQWIGMEKLLLRMNYPHIHADPFNPLTAIETPTGRIAFIAVRWGAATLLVPVMEELFWRDFVWRSIAAPNNFKLAQVGEWDVRAFWLVPLIFGTVHIQWLTAIVWALMIGVLLLRTKSLGACIIAHGVTNFLLGAYVLWTHDWYFW